MKTLTNLISIRLLAVLMAVTLWPITGQAQGVAAQTKTSELQDGTTIYLNTATTLTVDEDRTLTMIDAGGYLDLTINLQSGKTLYIKPSKKGTGIYVRNLTVKGSGTLRIDGGNLSVHLAETGVATFDNTNAYFTNCSSAIRGLGDNSVIINNSTVQLLASIAAFGGFASSIYDWFDLKDFTIKGEGSNVAITGYLGMKLPQQKTSYNMALENFNVEGGVVALANREGYTTVHSKNVNFTGGKITINQSGTASINPYDDAGIIADNVTVSDCELTMNTNWHGITATNSVHINNAKVNIAAGTKSHAINGCPYGIQILGEKTELSANGSRGGIVVDGPVTIKCKSVFAKARTEGYVGIYTTDKLYIDVLNSDSRYESHGDNTMPFWAEQGIYVTRPYYIETAGGNMTYREGDKCFHHYKFPDDMHSKDYWAIFQAPELTLDKLKNNIIHVGQSGTFNLGVKGWSSSWLENVNYKFRLMRVNPDNSMDEVDTKTTTDPDWTYTYTFQPSDDKCYYFGMVSADAFTGEDGAPMMYHVLKLDNSQVPVKPLARWRLGNAWVLNPSKTTGTGAGITGTHEIPQEYLVLTTFKDVSSLTEEDWKNAITPTDFSSSFNLPTVTAGSQVFVYTRYAATTHFNAGKVVEYTTLNTGTSDKVTKSVRFEAEGVNNPITLDMDGIYVVPLNTIVKVTELPIPDNATDFVGSLAEEWRVRVTKALPIYADEACTQEILKDGSHSYKTVYFKATSPTTNWNDMTVAMVYDYNSLDPNVSSPWVRFIVTTGSQDVPLIDATIGDIVRMKPGEVREFPIDYYPLMASNTSFKFINAGSSGTVPKFTVDNTNKTVTVDCTGCEPGAWVRAKFADNTMYSRIYVVPEEQEGITVTPSDITINPSDGSVQLTAGVYPESAGTLVWENEYPVEFIPASLDDITWKSSNTNVATVDANGLVTLVNASANVGKTVTITATSGDISAKSVITVGGTTYQLWVNGIQVNSSNQDDILGDGKVSFAGDMLSLNGVSIDAGEKFAVQSLMDNIVIELSGSNTLRSSNSTTAMVLSNATFVGDGSLRVIGTNAAAAIIGGYITVTDAVNVYAEGKTAGVLAMQELAVTSPTATLHAKGDTYSVASASPIHGVVTEPAGAVLQAYDDAYVATDASGSPIAGEWVTITGDDSGPKPYAVATAIEKPLKGGGVERVATLTFYYDDQMDSRSGTTYTLNTSESPAWYTDGLYADVNTVVFDESFAEARPASTFEWFRGMAKLTTANLKGLEHLNTMEIRNMGGMFANCKALTELDLSTFDTHGVQIMDDMFAGCSKLTTIYVDRELWSVENVSSSDKMFFLCTNIVGEKGTTYNLNATNKKSYAHIDEGPDNPGYLTEKPDHIPGDVNEDGEVNINDVVAIINQMAGTASWRYANVNEDPDGNVDINDVVAVINIMAGK